MKLDVKVLDEIYKIVWNHQYGNPYKYLDEFFEELNLVFKPGDSSQSVLVALPRKE